MSDNQGSNSPSPLVTKSISASTPTTESTTDEALSRTRQVFFRYGRIPLELHTWITGPLATNDARVMWKARLEVWKTLVHQEVFGDKCYLINFARAEVCLHDAQVELNNVYLCARADEFPPDGVENTEERAARLARVDISDRTYRERRDIMINLVTDLYYATIAESVTLHENNADPITTESQSHAVSHYRTMKNENYESKFVNVKFATRACVEKEKQHMYRERSGKSRSRFWDALMRDSDRLLDVYRRSLWGFEKDVDIERAWKDKRFVQLWTRRFAKMSRVVWDYSEGLIQPDEVSSKWEEFIRTEGTYPDMGIKYRIPSSRGGNGAGRPRGSKRVRRGGKRKPIVCLNQGKSS